MNSATTTDTRILIVEDDENLRLTLLDILEDEYRVSTAPDLADAKRTLDEQDFHLIILDLMLPDGNGYTFCRGLRDQGCSTPVLMLTARSLEDDLVKGFHMGADDYLVKPYRTSELLVRVKALLKRVHRASPSEGNEFAINGFRVNRSARAIRNAAGDLVELTPKELDVILYLWDNAQKAVSRTDLLKEVWGNVVIDSRTVDNFISSIKKKLDLSAGNAVYIETVRGVGYRLEKSPVEA